MGGDDAPKEIVAGALAAMDCIGADDELVLFGDETLVREHLGDPARWQAKISIVHAPQVVTMEDSPVDALRKKRKSSIAVMAEMAADGGIDGVLSAGNTGACVAACQLRMRLMPGVLRPGIMVVFPTFSGPVLICDVGANIAPKPHHLYQYALMTSIYAREMIGIENPTVGLISVGQEDAKGNELIKKTNQLLRDDPSIDFVGNVESRDFINRPADVIICDGFTGNVILKLTEGLAAGLFKAIMQEIAESQPEMVPQFQPVMERIYSKHDYNDFGGAPLLGVGGICMICHGSSDARGIKNAILKTKQQISCGVTQKIADQLSSMGLTDE